MSGMPRVSQTAKPLTNLRVAFALSLFLATFAVSPGAGTGPTGSDATFRGLVLERMEAYGRGDVRTYMGMLSDEFVHISDLGERRTRNGIPPYVIGHGNDRATYDITELSWRIEGNLAIVNARLHEHRTDFDGGQREIDIFTWRGGRWLYTLHGETAVWQRPVAMTTSEDRLADYAGRYRTADGTIDIITVSGGFIEDRSLPDAIATSMVHIARGAFGFAHDPTLLVFLRDPNGSVTQCLWHLPSGRTVLSRKVN